MVLYVCYNRGRHFNVLNKKGDIFNQRWIRVGDRFVEIQDYIKENKYIS